MSKVDIFAEDSSSVNTPLRGSPVIGSNNFPTASPDKPQATKISLDQIASTLLKQNFILTALEFHTELAETGRELPRLRDFFSNPANFEQQQQFSNTNTYSYNGSIGGGGGSGFYPLHKASSIQTFDSLDLTRYSDDVGESKFDDKIAVLEFELRKAKETIHQLRNTLTLATGKYKIGFNFYIHLFYGCVHIFKIMGLKFKSKLKYSKKCLYKLF